MKRLPAWCRDAVLLGPDSPLPIDRPFSVADAAASGVDSRLRRELMDRGLIRPVLRGVLVASQVQDSLSQRVAAAKLVVPDHAVVVDRTAAWVQGVEALPRSAIHTMPSVDVFSRSGSRMRRASIRSGIRELTDRDIVQIDGLAMTSPLRTACDLGRLLWRFDGLAAIDGFLRLGLDHAELLAEVDRFKGQRGVVQLRALAPLGDRKAESPPESALRLHWHDAELPWPEMQIWVHDGDHARYRIDLGLEQTRYGAEYFGEEFHHAGREHHDEQRLAWLRENGWLMDVFTKADVYGSELVASDRLARGFAQARRTLGLRGRTVIDLSR